MKKDLRQFLRVAEEKTPHLFARVGREVSTRWELSAVQKRLETDGRLPILLFESVAGHRMPVVANLFASKEHLALALDTTADQVVPRFAEAQKERNPPRVVPTGPVKDVILTGERADLRILPLVTHCEKDAGAYLSSGVTILRDPESGALNGGIYRTSFFQRRSSQ